MKRSWLKYTQFNKFQFFSQYYISVAIHKTKLTAAFDNFSTTYMV